MREHLDGDGQRPRLDAVSFSEPSTCQPLIRALMDLPVVQVFGHPVVCCPQRAFDAPHAVARPLVEEVLAPAAVPGDALGLALGGQPILGLRVHVLDIIFRLACNSDCQNSWRKLIPETIAACGGEIHGG